jgi:Flp pilus assembly protein TadG
MYKALFDKTRECSRGATAVEFAFILPILLLFLFGFFEFCMVLFTQSILHYSAEEATRYAMVSFQQNNLDATYIATVKNEIEAVARSNFIMIDPANISSFLIDIIPNETDNTKTINVTIDYSYSMTIPFLTTSTFTLSGSSASFLVQ